MIYPIIPVAKPRMTRRDKRLPKRPCVARYHAFKDRVRLNKVKLPTCGAHVIFYLPIPKSRQKTVKAGNPHECRPDWDNLAKALCDAVYGEDSVIWDIRITKRWADEGAIEIITPFARIK